jgi:hypothetical protein
MGIKLSFVCVHRDIRGKHPGNCVVDARREDIERPGARPDRAGRAAGIQRGSLRCTTDGRTSIQAAPEARALDLPLVFNNVESSRSMVGPGPEPQRLADQMSAAWIAFARTGNPNAGGLPRWPPYDIKSRATMIFNVESKVQNDPYAEIRRILVK